MPVERMSAEGLARPPGYAHVARGRGTVVCSAGSVPLDEDGRVVGPGDHVAQAQRCLANLEVALLAAGASPADVLKITVYVVGPHDALLEVWSVIEPSPFGAAASTLLGVHLLGYRDQLVEIEAIAVID
jgi:enamine deaminase RidA (YjgF/YER057c/UK114 family)